MQSSFRLGKVFGIDIDVHYTWFVVFALVSWSLAVGFFPQLFPGWPISTYWLVGTVSSLLLFVSVLLHELAHSVVARSEGIPVRSITLFIFGGVSNIHSNTPRCSRCSTSRDRYVERRSAGAAGRLGYHECCADSHARGEAPRPLTSGRCCFGPTSFGRTGCEPIARCGWRKGRRPCHARPYHQVIAAQGRVGVG